MPRGIGHVGQFRGRPPRWRGPHVLNTQRDLIKTPCQLRRQVRLGQMLLLGEMTLRFELF